MKVITIAFNRFHIYDQARELENNNLLVRMITNYPKYRSRDFEISDKFVFSLLFTGVVNFIRIKLCNKINPNINSNIIKYLHNKFSKDVVRHIPNDIDIAIFLSSFGLEGIEFCNNNNIISISDHGSVYLPYQFKIIEEERRIFDLEPSINHNKWIIEKELKEFNSADYILLGSNFAKETFLQNGFLEKKIIVNNYGVDLESFRKIDKSDKVFRIIFVGSVNINKGIHYLLKAFNILNLENSELWVIGGGYPNKDIDTVFKKMDINFKNVYFKGSFPQAELYKYYSQASVFCLPSLSDGFGMVVPQALACGLPVIVSENTGAKDIVKEDYNGYVIPIRDVESIKEKLSYLYENKQKLITMSNNALQSVKYGLTWEDYGNRLTKDLKKAMEK